MSGRFAATVALYALFCAAVLAATAIAGRARGQLATASLVALELALTCQAAACLITVAGGSRPSEAATFGGYLATSVALLPLSAARLNDRGSRWDATALAVVCVSLAVVVWRLYATWAG